MKRVVSVKLLPVGDQDQRLAATLRACNTAANQVSAVARARGITSGRDLRAVTYGETKILVPGAQAAQQVIRKVTDAYKTHRANLRAGNYGRRGTDRRAKAETRVIGFRPDAAQPYDDRILSWRHDQSTVSIWVVDAGNGKPGRITVPFTGHPDHLALAAKYRKGESDLICRNGKWYLIATLDLPDVPVTMPAETTEGDWVGVDLGITNIATTSDDTRWAGGAVTTRRKRNVHLRRRLQAKGTKSAKRLLKKRARREARWAADVNHTISKQIVAEAKRTGRGIALENLTGIRDRVRHRKPQRATFSSWSFAQLGGYIAYKAEAAGVAVVHVDPAYTSQTCHQCRHRDKRNRDGETFACRGCGVVAHADHNAARNIAHLAPATWAAERQGAVSRPHAARPLTPSRGEEQQARSFRAG